MNIELITLLACSKTNGYTLHVGENTSRELYILTENKDPDDILASTKYHCIVIYNDLIIKEGKNSKEKIYVDSFHENDSISWNEILDDYENREPFRLRTFFTETEVKEHINHLIKRENEHRANMRQFLDEKKEIKSIMEPLLQINNDLEDMDQKLELLDLTTDNGNNLKKDAKYLIKKAKKLSKRLGGSQTES